MLGTHASGGQDPNAWWYGDRDTLHFLVDGYRPATFWFELVDFLRKLLMAGAFWQCNTTCTHQCSNSDACHKSRS